MRAFKPAVVWHYLQASLWVVPATIVIGAAATAAALVALHERMPPALFEDWPALFGAGADGSRAMLTAIAGSMITVAGVVFSITLVALSLASTQYSPRVLRNFLTDRANQTVLGVFVGVFAYCLVVLRSIRGADEGAFVPALAVLVGIVLAFVGIGFLIFFIHHVATSIQASSIMERIANESIECLGRGAMVEDDPSQTGDAAERDARPLPAACSSRRGYVTSIDYESLNRLAETMRCLVRIERGVGEFAIQGQPLASIKGRTEVGKDCLDAIAATFEISRQRTAELDPAFGMRQLVDVALKSLSSNANDPTTASTAVDYLTAVLVEEARAAQRTSGGARGSIRGCNAGLCRSTTCCACRSAKSGRPLMATSRRWKPLNAPSAYWTR